MDEPGDDRYDFWISLGSDELQHVGHWYKYFLWVSGLGCERMGRGLKFFYITPRAGPQFKRYVYCWCWVPWIWCCWTCYTPKFLLNIVRVISPIGRSSWKRLSPSVRNIFLLLYSKFHNQTCDLLPPNSIRERHPDWSVYMAERLVKCKTLLANWEEERQIALVEGRFKVFLFLTIEKIG